jgi:hypothetical protein
MAHRYDEVRPTESQTGHRDESELRDGRLMAPEWPVARSPKIAHLSALPAADQYWVDVGVRSTLGLLRHLAKRRLIGSDDCWVEPHLPCEGHSSMSIRLPHWSDRLLLLGHRCRPLMRTG